MTLTPLISTVKVSPTFTCGFVVDAAWYMWLGSTQIYEIIPGFIAGLLAAWVISLLTKKPSEEVLSLFEKSRQPQE
jgi:sodium/proline symporter